MPRIVGVFGGTFDPVHNGHVQPISELLQEISFEKILVIPNSSPPHRDDSEISFRHRYEMTSLAFKDVEKTMVEYREGLRNGPSYAIDTVKEIAAEEEGARVIMIVGSDSFADIHTWHRWKELIALVDFIIMKRPNMPLSNNKKSKRLVTHTVFSDNLLESSDVKNIFEIEVTPFKISSSIIRENIAKGKKIDNLVNPLVKDYLKKHGLYGSKNST